MNHHHDLAGLDLNLVVVLDAVLRHRSASGAARELDRTQSAVSHALNRLREHFEDPLFQRVGNGLAPTPMAASMADEVHRLVGELHALLYRKPIEPSALERRVRVALSPAFEWSMFPGVVSVLRGGAPKISVEARIAVPGDEERLLSNELDLLLVGREPANPELERRLCYSDALMCAVRRGHPRIKTRLELDELAAEEHVSWPGEPCGTLDSLLEQRGARRRITVSVAHPASALHVVARTDLVAFVPGEMADAVSDQLDLRFFSPPVPVPAVGYWTAWAPIHHHDPGHRWIREEIAAALGSGSGAVTPE